MPIPPLDRHGLLPPGEWRCTLDEIEQRFCWNPHRERLFGGLRAFLGVEWVKLAVKCPIYVDGSFVRAKELPSDIDVVMDLTDIDDPRVVGMALLFGLQREAMRQAYNLDIWARHPVLPRDLVTFFQYIGTKAEAELNLPAKHPKGILRIEP